MRTPRSLLAGAVLAASVPILAIQPVDAVAPPGGDVFVNELHYDNDGADVGEFVEVAGPAGTDLSGWSIVLYNGSSSQRSTYDTVLLSGTIPDQDDGYGTVAVARSGIQNGEPDGLALVDPTGAVRQFLSYEGTFEAASGAAVGLTSTDIGVTEGASTPAGFSLQLTGTGMLFGDFTWSAPADDSPGAVNDGQDFGAGGGTRDPDPEPDPGTCLAPATPIHVIQGSGDASPLVGGTVTVEGIVVGDFQEGDGDTFGSDLDGFYVQEEAGDFDAEEATSEGIFVHAPGAIDVSQGDVVRITGTVAEFNGLTQLTGDPSVTGCSTGGDVPAPIDVPQIDSTTLERYEGMLVQLSQDLVISEYFNFDRFGEISLCQPLPGQDRLYQPTAVAEPGSPEAQAVATHNDRSCITLDDGRTVQNPDPARHPNGMVFDLDNRFRGGDVLGDTTGIVDFRFGTYRIQPTTGAEHQVANPRPDAPQPVGGDLRVAAFNVLNYFTTLGERGADSPQEFQRQQAKIVAALAAIDADVFGLIEIENNGDTAVANLVDALNGEVGAGTYDYVETGAIGTDEIKQAVIYKPATVTPVGDHAVLDTPAFVDPNSTGTPKNRPALAQSFQDADGGVFTVVVNHLKSKGSSCGAGDDDDEQGNCNLTRALAAGELVDWLATDPTGVDDPDHLIIGDLNAYDHEDPIDQVREGADDTAGTGDDYVDLLLADEGERSYSYLFDGQLGYLDYALASESLRPQITGATSWHINADEPDILDYDTTFKRAAQDALYEPNPYRSSDHDPVIVGLTLTSDVCDVTPPAATVRLSPTVLWPPNGRYVDVRATVDVDDPEATLTLISVTSDEPDDGKGDGNTTNDIVILDDLNVEVRAERSGPGDGRTYTFTYELTDDCGNSTTVQATVEVPKNRGGR